MMLCSLVHVLFVQAAGRADTLVARRELKPTHELNGGSHHDERVAFEVDSTGVNPTKLKVTHKEPLVSKVSRKTNSRDGIARSEKQQPAQDADVPHIPDDNPYPSADHPGIRGCNNGESFQTDPSSFLLNESNAASRFLDTFLPILPEQRPFLRTTSGCASGTLWVMPGLPEKYKKGIFAIEKSYPLLARFSGRNDLPALRFSIKAFGVEATMLPPPGPTDLEQNTQDFIFGPIADANGMALSELAARNNRGDATSIKGIEKFLARQNVTASLLDHGEMRSDDHTGQQPDPSSLTVARYNMNVGATMVNRFGGPTDPAAKFFIRGFVDPATGSQDTPLEVTCINASLGEDQYTACVNGMFQEALTSRMTAGPLELPFYANLQGCEDSIEDALTPWSTTDVKQIATLKLTAAADLSVCENAAFTPWHSAEDLRPLGSWQRVRKNTYYEAAVQRGAVAATLPEEQAGAGASITSVAPMADQSQGKSGGSRYAQTSLMASLVAMCSLFYTLGLPLPSF